MVRAIIAGANEGETGFVPACIPRGSTVDGGGQRPVSDAVRVVDFLALAAFLVAAARAQTLARQDRDHLLGRRVRRQFVADAIWHHRQARALPA
ncbi:hypothetical protein BVI2075_180009 [Burkholderia vietnamiensis]|nr:hypothetical protein BVI2075_180009 [Burkholderia vietnamiensis]